MAIDLEDWQAFHCNFLYYAWYETGPELY